MVTAATRQTLCHESSPRGEDSETTRSCASSSRSNSGTASAFALPMLLQFCAATCAACYLWFEPTKKKTKYKTLFHLAKKDRRREVFRMARRLRLVIEAYNNRPAAEAACDMCARDGGSARRRTLTE